MPFHGEALWTAHYKCNLQLKKSKFTLSSFTIWLVMTNLFVKNLGKTEVNIKCNPNNEEKYISFGKDVVVGPFQKKLTSRTSFALSTASSSWLLLSINWLVI